MRDMYEKWRAGTLFLMERQRCRYPFGMYKNGFDAVYEMLRAAAWLGRDGIFVTINLMEGEECW